MKNKDKVTKAIVYMATNMVNGKRYVGVTSQSLALRMYQHKSASRKGNGAFYRAIRKYGFTSFIFDVLAEYTNGHEALRGEISYIAQIGPEYNSTLGGEGQLGRKLSDDAKKRIGAASKNRKSRLGVKETPQQIAAKRELGLRNKAKFAQHAHLGPQALARPVLCITDGSEYPSAAAAARHYNVHKGALIELCLGQRKRKTVGGLVFSYKKGDI